MKNNFLLVFVVLFCMYIPIGISPRLDNLNIQEQSITIGIDKANPTLNAFNLSGIRNATFTNNPMVNLTVNATDLFLNTTTIYIDNLKNETSVIANSTNATIMLNITTDGNYTFKAQVNDLAGHKSNFSYFYNLVIDTTIPRNISPLNRTVSGNSTNILDNTNVNLTVEVRDTWLDSGNFSENCTLTSRNWINHSVAISGNQTYHNVLESANFTANQVCGWKYYFYDRAGNELDPIFTFAIGDSSVATAEGGSGGGSGSGSSFNLNQLECNQRAKQQNKCLTYNSDSKSCEIGCPSSYVCNEDFVCQGAFLQPDYIPLANLFIPNLQEEQCISQGYSFFQDDCYNCAGKLANLKGTIVCLQCREGYRLDDNNLCFQTLQQRTQQKLNFIDNLARKISPNNPFLGFLIMIGTSGIIIYAYSNRKILRTKIRRS